MPDNTQTIDENRPHWKKRSLVKSTLLHVVILGICITVLCFAMDKFIVNMTKSDKIFMIIGGYLIAAILILAGMYGVYYVGRKTYENYRKLRILNGKTYERPYVSKPIPLYKKHLDYRTKPIIEPFELTEERTEEPIDESLAITPDYEALRQSDLLGKILAEREIDTRPANLIAEDFPDERIKEVDNLLLLAFSGINRTYGQMTYLSLNVLRATTKIMNRNVLFVSNAPSAPQFLGLDESLIAIQQKINNKENFNSIAYITTQNSPSHLFVVRGEMIGGEYRICIDDSLTRRLADDKDPSSVHYSGFSQKWKENIYDKLEGEKPPLIFYESGQHKQLFGAECGIFSIYNTYNEYFDRLGCVPQMYNSHFEPLTPDRSNYEAEYGNYNIFIYERVLVISILQRNSVIEDFFVRQFSLNMNSDSGNALQESLKNTVNSLKEDVFVIALLGDFLQKNRSRDPKSETYKNNLAKYDAQLFEYYAQRIASVYSGAVEHFPNLSSNRIDDALKEDGKIGKILKAINKAFNPIVLTETPMPLVDLEQTPTTS